MKTLRHNTNQLTDEVLAIAPDDSTHFHPYNDGNTGTGAICSAFFHKEEDGKSYYSYGKEFGWIEHYDIDSCPKRRVNMIQIDNLLKVKGEFVNPDQGVPFETPLSDKEVASLIQTALDDFDAEALARDFCDYPLPEWALCENKHKVLVPGTQLATKDGRNTGNAHIIRTHTADWDSEVRVYQCLTDAGSKINMLESELRNQFYIGTFISHVDDVLDKFDRHNLFFKEPK